MTIKVDLQSVKILGSLESSSYPSNTTRYDVLTKGCLEFLVILHKTFNQPLKDLLANRAQLQSKINKCGSTEEIVSVMTKELQIPSIDKDSVVPSFSTITNLGKGLERRHCEITGPPKRNMLVNALNTSKADCYMVDFEDSSAPTWDNMIDGQVNLYDAIRNQIDFKNPINSKEYKLMDEFINLRTVLVRPRGLHLLEKHLIIDDDPISASLFDFGVYFYHNAQKLIDDGKGPYFYIPKLEHHLEAKWWDNVFNVAQDLLQIPRGTIRCTLLIETLPAAFQLHEFIFQLRTHISGLNCGRYDYMFSTIKTLQNHKQHVLPNRDIVTMGVPFMSAYALQLPKVCHFYGISSIGGMAAQLKSEEAIKKVLEDKTRELERGFDGSWSATPALCEYVAQVFNQMLTPNQIHNIPQSDEVSNAQLVDTSIPGSKITEEGIRVNIEIGLRYMEAWVRGNGCIAINNLMEDAATAEVSAKMLWQWVKHAAVLESGDKVTKSLVEKILEKETKRLVEESTTKGDTNNKYELVSKIFYKEIFSDKFSDFITLPLYEEILTLQSPLDISTLKD
ncbi:related to Malate synthase 1, glyoxysomal [Hanseniaspora guilliermondii]|uniref:malate synthase n=1 Tax=Hanseniaspora guilliermondii TaxID=56406 RepID=A0A1L0D1W5_9ASCO|nr:related to Malate synthase 1, glyoxysomal [Hanseniaspora guilliermondii]